MGVGGENPGTPDCVEFQSESNQAGISARD